MQWEYSLFNRVKDIQSRSFLNEDEVDESLPRCYVMTYLASYFKLKNYVEIGVYQGRSLFSVAQVFKDNEGKAYGIDPYLLASAKEQDSEKISRKVKSKVLEEEDLEAIYNQVLMNTKALELTKVIKIIRKTSTEAALYFKAAKIDMLHIDGNHDLKSVQDDIDNYSPLIREGGIIIFNRIDLESVKRCYDQYKSDYIILLETKKFGILMKHHNNKKILYKEVDLPKKLKNLYFRLIEIRNKTEEKKITVNVGVLAYNHEKYIVDCLNSIVKQKGDFNLNIIISEDKSSDATAGIVEAYINNVEVAENVTF